MAFTSFSFWPHSYIGQVNDEGEKEKGRGCSIREEGEDGKE